MMLPHLKHEEDVLLPLLRAYFTHKDVAPIVKEIVANGPNVEMGSFIHFMVSFLLTMKCASM